jgi:hypothetical protein
MKESSIHIYTAYTSTHHRATKTQVRSSSPGRHQKYVIIVLIIGTFDRDSWKDGFENVHCPNEHLEMSMSTVNPRQCYTDTGYKKVAKIKEEKGQ